jgi:hypothetical protein
MEAVGLPVGGSTGSALSHLEGALSGWSYTADGLIGLDPSDSKPLLARYDLSTAAKTLSKTAVPSRTAGGLFSGRPPGPSQVTQPNGQRLEADIRSQAGVALRVARKRSGKL